LPFVVIEQDPFVYQRASSRGVPCIFGDASLPVVLDQARITEARGLAVTFVSHPSGAITVQNARRLNPDLDVVARSTGPEDRLLLREAGASEVVEGDFEASLEIVRHVLQRYGIDAREISALQAGWRAEYYRI
jgi:CPA2 family monovalent cation:H+ antiporter-2